MLEDDLTKKSRSGSGQSENKEDRVVSLKNCSCVNLLVIITIRLFVSLFLPKGIAQRIVFRIFRSGLRSQLLIRLLPGTDTVNLYYPGERTGGMSFVQMNVELCGK